MEGKMIQSNMMIVISEKEDGTPDIVSAKTRAGTVVPSKIDISPIAEHLQAVIDFIQEYEDGKDLIIQEGELKVASLKSEVTRLKRMFRTLRLGEVYAVGEKVYDEKNDLLIEITAPLDENSTIDDLEKSTVVLDRGK